jgi:hypothetical protein
MSIARKRHFQIKIKRKECISGLVLLCAITGTFNLAAAQKVASDREHVELIYSEEDDLCRPLAGLYDELNHIHHYTESEGSRIDIASPQWEDKYASKFSAIGLDQPKPLNDTLHPFSQSPLHAYYKVDLTDKGVSQLVYVEDERYGGHIEGDLSAFGTNVWIIKPGAEIQMEDYQHAQPTSGEVITTEQPSPSIVELGIFFIGTAGSGRFRMVPFPYFFNKIVPKRELHLPRQKRRFDLAIGSNAPQRLFKFRDEFIFTARTSYLGTAMVYRVMPNGTLADVCYFASSGTIDFSRRNKKE